MKSFSTAASVTIHRRLFAPRCRGIALLLVMIGLVVCTLLTAGFLSTQGTAIGIARNERDAEAARLYAQTGIDLCYSLIRNKSYWRESMTPGRWLNAYAVGNGTVTVSAASGDGSSSFATDTTQPVILTSTGSCNNRSFTLTGTISPTGAGTVFRGGNFFQGQITLGTPLSLTTAIIDSYNSLLAPYNSLLPGSNALFASNSTLAGTLSINNPSSFKGSFTAGPGAVLSSVVSLLNGLLFGPSSTTAATESRVAGTVVPPNFAGQTSQGAFSQTKNTVNIAPGVYDSYTTSNVGGPPTTVFSNGSYQILNNLSAATGSKIQIANGANVVLYVVGNTTFAGTLTFAGTGSLTIYSGGTFTATSALINAAGNTANVQILGLPTSGQINLNSSSQMAGVIFAPQTTVTMQTGSSKLYGAVVAKSLNVYNTAQFHYDEATSNIQINNVTGGSAPQGTAVYNYSVR